MQVWKVTKSSIVRTKHVTEVQFSDTFDVLKFLLHYFSEGSIVVVTYYSY